MLLWVCACWFLDYCGVLILFAGSSLFCGPRLWVAVLLNFTWVVCIWLMFVVYCFCGVLSCCCCCMLLDTWSLLGTVRLLMSLLVELVCCSFSGGCLFVTPFDLIFDCVCWFVLMKCLVECWTFVE